MPWLWWLRGFSIRSRLLACMALVVGIGVLVGGVMSARLLGLRSDFNAFSGQEFGAVEEMVLLSQSLGQVRVQEKNVLIFAGDSVSASQAHDKWQTVMKDVGTRAQAVIAAAPTPAIAQEAQQLQARLDDYRKQIGPTLELVASGALSSTAEAHQSTESARDAAHALEAVAKQLAQDISKVATDRRDNVAQRTVSTIITLWVLLCAPGVIFLPLMALTIFSRRAYRNAL